MRISFPIIILTALLLSSCATISHRSTYDLEIRSDVPDAQIQVQDSVYRLPAKVPVRRSKEDLKISLLTDSAAVDYVVKPSLSGRFLYGNLLWMQVMPLAYAVDLTNTRRYEYGKYVYLRSFDTTRIVRTPRAQRRHNYYSKRFYNREGQLNLTFSLPHINSFYLRPQGEPLKVSTGFFGGSLGAEYFYHPRKFAALSFHSVTDFIVPVPAPVDFSGERETMNSHYLSATNNLKFGRFGLWDRY